MQFGLSSSLLIYDNVCSQQLSAGAPMSPRGPAGQKRQHKIAALALALAIPYLSFVSWLVVTDKLRVLPTWFPLVIFIGNFVICFLILKWYAMRLLKRDGNES
jgi:hypothetical protein